MTSPKLSLENGLHTYFLEKSSNDITHDPRVAIGDDNGRPYPSVTPYYIDPLLAKPTTPNPDHRVEHFKCYHVKAVIMDPFTSVHLFTPILPIKSISLPSWSVQMACRKMTAFFHLGPVLLTKDVPSYDTLVNLKMLAKASIDGSAGVDAAKPDPTAPALPSVAMPMNMKNKWRWLQPYEMDCEQKRKMEVAAVQAKMKGKSVSHVQGQVLQEKTAFGSLPLVEDDGKIKLPPGPYTAVEGYLQLLEGIVKSSA